MGASLLVMLAVTASAGQSIHSDVVEQQNQVFQRWWGSDFVWKFDDLPAEGSVDEWRIPYSGHIYPDSSGGTVKALRKYDRAYNGGQPLAENYERRDTTAYKPVTRYITERYGWRGRFTRTRRVTTYGVPHWYGHCNGWTSAAIRHAEPVKTVVRNGVEFTPADIKAMLAEIYMYLDCEMLDGDGGSVNPGTLHAILTNWIGRGKHPIAMEADPGKEKWNYPIYKYVATHNRRSRNDVDVQMNLTYANSSRGELQESPRLPRTRYFNYRLKLDDEGNITGGYYYRGSSSLDMLWVPLAPKPGGKKGNERGCPHLDVDEVLAIWRESAPEDLRSRWAIIDPPQEDRLFSAEQLAQDIAPAEASSTEVRTAAATGETADPNAVVTASASEAAADEPPTDDPATTTPADPAVVDAATSAEEAPAEDAIPGSLAATAGSGPEASASEETSELEQTGGEEETGDAAESAVDDASEESP